MWFKQIQYYQMTPGLAYQPETLAAALEQLVFSPCMATMPMSLGWVPPLDMEEAPLVHAAQGYLMICLQIEEKVLPAAVVRQEVEDEVKQIMRAQDRRVYGKEKQKIKENIISKLLPRAFCKRKRIYAYIDTKRNTLIVDSINQKELELWMGVWKKVLPGQKLVLPALKKLGLILTHWLQHQSYPSMLAINQACVLSDPNQQSRTIRCQHQDLTAQAIDLLMKDGCVPKQLALAWQDNVSFTLTDEFQIRGLRFEDEIKEQASSHDVETPGQRFDADFVIMTEIISHLMQDLLAEFAKEKELEAEEV